ncbi:hypothetical protein HDU97_007559 [Phlyctochytrium planicorne]|nr:hypothetical protein HDU97_007559 [Phlyctochytrium planicorne]
MPFSAPSAENSLQHPSGDQFHSTRTDSSVTPINDHPSTPPPQINELETKQPDLFLNISLDTDNKSFSNQDGSSANQTITTATTSSCITIIEETDSKQELSKSPDCPPAAKPSKLIYFEGLRGIAALQVVFIHTLSYFLYLDRLTRGGIITRSILQSNADKKSSEPKLLKKLLSSFVRRPFRFLLPLYFGSLYKIFLIKYIGLQQDGGHALPESTWFFFKEPLRFLIYGINPTQPFLPVPAWTLYPEMLGSMVIYIVTAVLLPYAENPRIRYTVLGTMFLFFFLSDNWSFYFLIGYTISDISISGYIAKFNRWKHKLLTKILMFAFSCIITFEYSERAHGDDKNVEHPNPIRAKLLEWLDVIKINTNPGWNFPEHSLLVFYCTTVFFLIESTPLLQRWLSIRPVAYLGRISFMLYLLHQDTALAMTPITDKWLEYGLKGWIARFLLDMAVCILVADLATRLFDEPLQKVVRRAEKLILHDKWYILPVRKWPAFMAGKASELRAVIGERLVGARKAMPGPFKRRQL